MSQRPAATALVFLLLCLLLPAAASAQARPAAPSLRVLSPTNGETVSGSNVTVRIETSNFTLTRSTVPLAEAGKQPQANKPGEGHVHLRLDFGPIIILDRGTQMTLANVPPGQHTLEVSLTTNDHSSLSPEVKQEIEFTTAPAATTGAGGPNVTSSSAAGQPPNRMPHTAEGDLLGAPFLLSAALAVAFLVVVGLATGLYGRATAATAAICGQLRDLHELGSRARRR